MYNKVNTRKGFGPMKNRSQAGASLVEVLVTVVVTSIGLLGMGGVMIVSQRVSHDSYLRTQANFIAQTMIDSMHINTAAVAAGDYDGSIERNDGAPSPDCEASACSPAERARFDRARLARTLERSLPNATASLACRRERASATPFYDGLCRLKIDWSLRPLSADSEAVTQTQVWHFQP